MVQSPSSVACYAFASVAEWPGVRLQSGRQGIESRCPRWCPNSHLELGTGTLVVPGAVTSLPGLCDLVSASCDDTASLSCYSAWSVSVWQQRPSVWADLPLRYSGLLVGRSVATEQAQQHSRRLIADHTFVLPS